MELLKTTEDVQEEIVKLLLSNKVFYFSVSNHIMPRAFVGDYSKITGAMVSFEKEYHTYPSGNAFRDFASKLFESYGYKEDKVNQLIHKITEYQTSDCRDIEDDSIVYYIHLLKRHKAQHNILDMLQTMGSLLEDQTSDLTQLTTMMYDAVSPLLENDTEQLTDILDVDGLKELLHQIYAEDDSVKCFRTGMAKLDKLVLRRGLREAQMGIFIAPTGAGKSFMLQNCSLTALEDGYNVLHVNCEMDHNSMLDRFYRAMVLQPRSVLKANLDDTYNLLLNELNAASKESTGRLHVWKPTENKSIMGIENKLRKDKLRGIEWDLVVIDYADELIETGGSRTDWEKVTEVYKGMKRLMDIYRVGIWTASQMSTDAAVQMISGERDIITSYDQAHSRRKAYYADYVFPMKQTAEEEASGRLRVSVAKARHSAKIGEVVIFQDFDRATFSM